jgi:hypothetical protein
MGGWDATPALQDGASFATGSTAEEAGPISLPAGPAPMVVVVRLDGWGAPQVLGPKLAPRSFPSLPTLVSPAGTADESTVSYGPQPPGAVSVSVFVPGPHLFADFAMAPPPFHVMLASEHASMGLSPDARFEAYHATSDAQDTYDESGQVLSQVDGVIGGGFNPAASPAHDARDIVPLPTGSDSMVVAPAVSLRGATVAHDHVIGLELAKGSDRTLVPLQLPALAMAVGEGMTGAMVEAAHAVQNAAAAVFTGRRGAEPIAAAAGAPQAELEAPAPQGVGLVAEVLPFDGNAVAAAIDRFFDRFDEPGDDPADSREPAALYPPPGVVLVAAVGLELARRRWQRKRDEGSAERPRRGDLNGLGCDELFRSSGPWSSRLS